MWNAYLPSRSSAASQQQISITLDQAQIVTDLPAVPQ